jgi:hypothetical protein
MIREYDDGYDSRDSFERADEDTWEQLNHEENAMTNDDYIHAAWMMERMGGGFAGHIARAYYVADEDNAQRLRSAFADLFSKFHAVYQRQHQGESK